MKPSGIGGQALMEGVMMKNGSHYACAVRKPDGTIVVDDQRTVLLGDKYKFFKLPIIRGVVTFVESLIIGVKTLTWSASFFDEDENDKDKDGNEEKPKEKTKEDKRKENILIGVLVVFSIALAIGLFMILPYFISKALKNVIESQLLLAFLEGLIRITLFVSYVAAISCMKDIKRVFMYHGAEHKSINCVESGYELNVENVRKCSREHKRCGTSFLLIVMVISIFFFMFIRFDKTIFMILGRLILIPLIAGISYEFIRLAGRTDNKIITVLSRPGLALQKLTTREPDDSMIECAIASVEAVFDWRAYQEDLRAEAEKKRQEDEQKKKEKRQKREEEIKRRLEAKGITEEEMSEEKIKEIDEKADMLAADEKNEEIGESIAREAADRAKSGKLFDE